MKLVLLKEATPSHRPLYLNPGYVQSVQADNNPSHSVVTMASGEKHRVVGPVDAVASLLGGVVASGDPHAPPGREAA